MHSPLLCCHYNNGLVSRYSVTIYEHCVCWYLGYTFSYVRLRNYVRKPAIISNNASFRFCHINCCSE
jgi:hypothetical protein